MKNIDRRKMLKLGGGAVALSGVVALCGFVSATDTALLKMEKEWVALETATYASGNFPDWAFHRSIELENLMISTPAMGPVGVLVKLRMINFLVTSWAADKETTETKLINGALKDLERIAA